LPYEVQPAEVVFDVVAGVGAVALALAVRRLAAEPAGPGRNDTRFLLAWLAVEAVGYLVLTPFPAARRVLGAFVVLTVLFGRLASRTCVTPGRRRLVRVILGFGVALGLAYLGIDWLGARAHRRGAEEAAAVARAGGGGRVWYTGHWGFQYYAERSGMEPVVPAYDAGASYVERPAPSRLRRGDWLVVPEQGVQKSELDLAALPHEEAGRVVVEDPVPLRVVPCFFGGRTPLEHHEGPRVTVRVYRVTGDGGVSLGPAAPARP
jgi:hypothetical protein